MSADLSGFFAERKIGYRGRDMHVWPIAKDIVQTYHASTIRGLLPRAFVDYNRSWPDPINYYPKTQKEVHTALDDVRLSRFYRYYHESISGMLGKSIDQFGKENVLLIDLHGFAKQPPYAPSQGYDLILGTGNRITIPHGDVDVQFAQYMCEIGYTVFLPQELSIGSEEDYYSADFTTRYHSETLNINVLQIEIASRFRKMESFEVGRKLAIDIAGFLAKYTML
jgi:N-formylglutamate amidohydrolase